MENYKVKVSQKAENDIIHIGKYISEELCDRGAAIRIVDEIERVIKGLNKMPKRHNEIQDEDYIIPYGIRRVGVENYQIYYTCSDEEMILDIWRVLYGKREWQKLLK